MDSSPMELLPTEILQKILCHLPVRDKIRVERVCKRWKKVSTEVVWRNIQVLDIYQVYGQYQIYCLTLSEFHQLGESISQEDGEHSIDINNLKTFKKLLIRAGPHVKEIIYDNSRDINIERVFSIIAKYCHNIEGLHLRSINDSEIKVFSRLLENNQQLRSITCCFYSDFVIEMLPLRDWKSLNFVSIICFDNPIYWTNVDGWWEEQVIALIENSPSLEKFYVQKWTPSILTAISKCKQLNDLFLPIDEKIATKDLIMHTSLLNRLRCLKVARYGAYEAENDLAELLQHCINLETLHLLFRNYEFSAEVQEAVLALPKLESLHLDISGPTNDFLIRLVKLKNLRLSRSNDEITDDVISKIITESERIEILEIPNIAVTTKLFERLVEYSKNHRLFLMMRVGPLIYGKASEICKDSGIHIFRDLHDSPREIRRW